MHAICPPAVYMPTFLAASEAAAWAESACLSLAVKPCFESRADLCCSAATAAMDSICLHSKQLLSCQSLLECSATCVYKPLWHALSCQADIDNALPWCRLLAKLPQDHSVSDCDLANFIQGEKEGGKVGRGARRGMGGKAREGTMRNIQHEMQPQLR